MLRWLNRLPWLFLVVLCLTLGLAPFTPEPHVVEKLRMLWLGTLIKPIDIVDLFMHITPFLLLFFKLGYTVWLIKFAPITSTLSSSKVTERK
ncbi:hypothetical protein [Beggiatoa leptomitoformis]|uniref:hypothetical protein n=1 Tax=Beggiatoa leptomitoformis TaxID=288004 RepID=UPI0007065E04|nr:hypothetical protein [Beggiatoa leptomitoformis]